jgi:uncharacterized protein (TIGR02996 family)
MTQEELLLQRVLQHPDEDAPRLDFAAFKTAHGDSRGDFIRVELALARTDQHDDANYVPLAEASYTLTDEHGPAFAGPIARMVNTYRFYRGFVEFVELPARRFLEIAPQLYALAPIRHVNLLGTRSQIGDLASSPLLEPLRSLSLQNWGLIDADIEVLAASPYLRNLRWLSLADNLLGMQGAEHLAQSPNFPSLQYVVFARNPVDPSEQYGNDQGIIIDSWMEESGISLEEKYGEIRWLHANPYPRKSRDVPPSRYIV